MNLPKYGLIVVFTVEDIDRALSLIYGERLHDRTFIEPVLKKEALKTATIPEIYWNQVETVVFDDFRHDALLVRLKTYKKEAGQSMWKIAEGAEFPQVQAWKSYQGA